MTEEISQADDHLADQQSLENLDSDQVDQVEAQVEVGSDEQTQLVADSATLDIPRLIIDLASADETIRAAALESLTDIETSTPEILRALEQIAAHDSSDELKQAALDALSAPSQQELRWRTSGMTIYSRKLFHAEIHRWEADELISPQQAAILLARYPLQAIPAAPKKKEVQRESPRSLKEALLSETAVKIVLYLGAFFVIMAAFIFAAVFKELRVPILGAVAVSAFATALALVRRLPQASFVFFTIGSFLIPITAGVLIDQVDALARFSDPYWTVVWAFLALVWCGGTTLYRSRFFSLLALWSASVAAFWLAFWVGESGHLIILLMTFPALLSLGGVYLLRRWQGKKLIWPLFIFAHLQQFVLLGISAIALMFEPPSGALTDRLWWLVVALTWLLSVGFYAGSQLLIKFPLFPLMAVGALVPVPLFVLGTFDPGNRLISIVAWIWGLLLVLGGVGAALIKRDQLKSYPLCLSLAGAIVFIFAAILGLDDLIGLGIAMLVGITLVYLGLTIWQRKTFTWSATVVAALWAYLSIFRTQPIANLEIGAEFMLLFPALFYLGGELVARKLLKIRERWYWPVRILGLLVAMGSGVAALINGLEQPWNAVIVFTIFAGFATLYALWDGRTLIGAAGTISLALSLPYWVSGLDWDHWLVLVYGLAALYWGAGTLLSLGSENAERQPKVGVTSNEGAAEGGNSQDSTDHSSPATGWSDQNFSRKNWSTLLRISGLALGALGAMTAPLQGGAIAVLGTAFIASFFVVEAIRLRNIWLGFPANFLYLVAYFIALIELDVNEPQYFSIGAALLGIVMHYLLVRGKHYLAAGITGVIAQLILLSTTYIQMVDSEKFSFFFILFLQSLILLIYGLIVRVRSFVVTPIIFAVLSVITVAFSVLSGIWTILLIGCTGTLLLALGVLALLLRERITKATAELSGRMGEWHG